MNMGMQNKQFSFQVDVRWCVDELYKDGRITQRDVNLVATTARRKEQLRWHPLQVVADFGLLDLANAPHKLTLMVLTAWLAAKAELPVFKIDPLR